jgi:hypothetical protein
MLTDTELERLLGEAAASFAVPEHEIETSSAPKRERPTWLLKAAAGVVVLFVGTAFAVNASRNGSFSDTSSTFAGSPAARDAGELQSGGTTGGSAPGSTDRAGAARVPGSLQPQTGAEAPLVPTSGLSGGGASVGGPTATPGDADGARVVKTATVALAVDDGKVRPAVVTLEQLVTRFHGYQADSTSSEAGDHPSADLTVRVPVASFDAFLAQVRALKVDVVSVTQSGRDVTASYADVQAQIRSLTAARERFLAILARTRTIGETLTVQQRVDDVQQQIDRLEGQRRVLANQSDLATVTISVAERGAENDVFVKNERSGWSKAWHDATHGFTSGVQGLVGASGRTLLVLLCGVALLLLGRTGWRLARRRLV